MSSLMLCPKFKNKGEHIAFTCLVDQHGLTSGHRLGGREGPHLRGLSQATTSLHVLLFPSVKNNNRAGLENLKSPSITDFRVYVF